MEEVATQNSVSGFAFYLAENRLLDNQVALDTLQEANEKKLSYIEVLTKKKLLDASLIAKATAEYFGLPFCDITAFNPELIPEDFLNMQLVRKRQVLPLFIKNNILYLAITDPTIENLYDIRFLTGLEIRFLITEAGQLTQIVGELLNRLIISEISDTNTASNGSVAVDQPQEDDSLELSSYDVESAPVVNYVNKVILEATEKNASDIHFERFENDYRIRYRINGILYPIAAPPIKLANYLLARIKIMASLDITEHRLPQDGRFKLTLNKHKVVDFRVSVCPTLFGEKIVLRILDPSQLFHKLDYLGMSSEQKNLFLDALSETQGIILVTGPTGSGKTVTLYSALSHLNSNEDNIMTVEDPVEIPLHGVNQVHVNNKVGLTFAAALRSFLRQDPDIIMIGEIRDLETAEISVKAAQTGHLVLSTLHTNSGPETIARLMYMGVEAYNLASSLKLVIAQRLLRALCDNCKKEENLPEDVLLKEGFKPEELSTLKIYKAGNCERCTFGYVGRTGIFEVLPISDQMGLLIMRGANALELTEQAKKENIMSLRESGLDKIRQGITSLNELNRTFR